MRLIGLLVVLAAIVVPRAAVSDSSVSSARAAAALGELRYEVTPGKPMQLARAGEPAERVTAQRTGARFTLIVARNVGTDFEEARAALTADEWRALEALVASRALATWKPHASGDQAFDYGTTAFALRGPDGKLLNEQRWSRPLDNESAPAALAAALGRLAKAKVPSPRLFYFGL